MQITVQAFAEEKHAPTRATITARVQSQGPQASVATQGATQTSITVADSIAPYTHEESARIEKWSQGALTTWSNRPWKDDGTQGDPVFYAAVTFAATFTDFTALAEWLAAAGELDDLEIQSVLWELSAEELEQYTHNVQVQAIHNAQHKALTYAQAAGYSGVTFVEVADTGLLENTPRAERFDGGMMRAAAFKESSVMDVRPEEVTVSAAVHAKFLGNKKL